MPEIPYHITCPKLNMKRETRYSPIEGIINSAIIHFPTGCQMLVEVHINHKTNQILPAAVKGGTQGNIGIALENTTQSFDINQPILRGEAIEVVITNHDGANPHTISTTILIAEKKGYTGP